MILYTQHALLHEHTYTTYSHARSFTVTHLLAHTFTSTPHFLFTLLLMHTLTITRTLALTPHTPTLPMLTPTPILLFVFTWMDYIHTHFHTPVFTLAHTISL